MKNPIPRLLALLLVAAALLQLVAPLAVMAAESDGCCEDAHSCCESKATLDCAPSLVCCDSSDQAPVLPPLPVVRCVPTSDVATAGLLAPVASVLQRDQAREFGDSPPAASTVFLLIERILI
jgi:hypothetical protein